MDLADVIVMGKTPKEHNIYLGNVHDQMREACLKLKPSKCRFTQIVV